MGTILIVALCALSGVMAACATEPPKSTEKSSHVTEWGVRQEAGPSTETSTSLEHPMIHAQLLTVASGTTIEVVGGTAYITRENQDAFKLLSTQVIEQDDHLQIHPDSVVRLRSADGEEVMLGREQGEWFRFSVRSE